MRNAISVVLFPPSKNQIAPAGFPSFMGKQNLTAWEFLHSVTLCPTEDSSLRVQDLH